MFTDWFKVGIVGQVFMDTANGLNQGRMDMDFCTQFFSEYASIPNAIGLVSLGTALAIPSFGDNVEPITASVANVVFNISDSKYLFNIFDAGDVINSIKSIIV